MKKRMRAKKKPAEDEKLFLRKRATKKEIKYRPVWYGALEGRAVNLISRNMWRMNNRYQFEDVYQEAFALFLHLRNRYSKTVDNGKWFMSLYDRALKNKLTDFANSSTAQSVEVSLCETSDDEQDDPRDNLPGETANMGELYCLLEQAPDEVKQVLTILLESPQELLELLYRSWKKNGRRNESGNNFLCALVGADPKTTDLEGAVKSYFST